MPIEYEIEVEDEEVEAHREKFEKTKDMVDYVLEHVEETRENDMLLWFWTNWVFRRDAMVKLGKLIYWLCKNDRKGLPNQKEIEIAKKVLSNLIPAETISRCRRKIQNDEGRHLPPKEVIEERKYKEELMRKVMAKEKEEEVVW